MGEFIESLPWRDQSWKERSERECVCGVGERGKKDCEIPITPFMPLAPGHHIFQVASKTVPKPGIWSLLIWSLHNNCYFFFLIQQSSLRSESQCPCRLFRCAPLSTAPGICPLTRPRSGKVELIVESKQPFRRGSQGRGAGCCKGVGGKQRILHIKAEAPERRRDIL